MEQQEILDLINKDNDISPFDDFNKESNTGNERAWFHLHEQKMWTKKRDGGDTSGSGNGYCLCINAIEFRYGTSGHDIKHCLIDNEKSKIPEIKNNLKKVCEYWGWKVEYPTTRTDQEQSLKIKCVSFNKNINELTRKELENFVVELKKWHSANFQKFIDLRKWVVEEKKNAEEIIMTEKMNEWNKIIVSKKNLILQGAPGTGKTYSTAELALNILGYKNGVDYQLKDNSENKVTINDRKSIMTAYNDLLIKDYQKYDPQNNSFGEVVGDGRIAFVTFHQSMDYEDFIEGIKPVSIDGGKSVAYPVKSGIFKAIANKAKEAYDKWSNNKDKAEKTCPNYVLIIDEINRGNVSKVFGELITLLEADKRHGEENAIAVTLPYSQEEFSVPSNLYIIGTMNTTDRSAGSLDYAIRRRFAFVTLESSSVDIDDSAKGLYGAVKTFIDKNKSDSEMDFEDLMIGHSYFMKPNAGPKNWLQMKWQYEILPLLMEYYKDGLLKESPLPQNNAKEQKEQKENYSKWITAHSINQVNSSNTPSTESVADEAKSTEKD